ncbi:hypothetical protein PyrSV_gp18 [Pyrobaculum spherical virus]|jgi:hypothetical protein|uniref:Uncharacterized protein n=1 Tax=Pyrobaculum spherical virus (isolate United States/Yellowstone) TaxID=654907 RepID=Q6ZYI5_PSVY|nr:hypothetical protein PyrSV_gp18 [Pyrobaculum spherical virus]CAG25637.1 hypothetical protein [Pyrobaculum spherical virus]
MKWFTHIIWGAFFPILLGVDVREAVSLAVFHTVLTDTLGHVGHGPYVRRASYHDVLSLFFGIMIAAMMHNLAYLWLGAIHVVLDKLSPGRLGVSYLYSLVWAIIPAIILYILGVHL